MKRVEDIPDDGIIIYDIETESSSDNPKDAVFPTYCKLVMISYQLGLGREPQLVNLESKRECDRLRELLADPEILKVSFNGINFDDIVLTRYGFYVEPKNRHDMFLALKTVAPNLAKYSLKFANWFYFGDWHEPERRLDAWRLYHSMSRRRIRAMWEAPEDILGFYCQHDVRQTANLFRMLWEVVQRPQHWDVYRKMELAMGEPLHEMVLFAGEWLDPDDIIEKIEELEAERAELIEQVCKLSKGQIKNGGSALQVSKYLHDVEKIDLELSEAGNYSVTKAELMELIPTHPIAKCVYEIRDLGKVIQHYRCHWKAANAERERRHAEKCKELVRPLDYRLSLSRSSYKYGNIQHNGAQCEVIPKGYTVSGARTRRFQSSSQYGINFQNQNKRTKVVQLVPEGWLGCWIDSRQIENIVHIWASNDKARRAAYEADPDWNEYVWLSNTILKANHSRKELEDIPSPLNPNISIYKQYKTIKLALNFFMGPAKFAKVSGLTEEQAIELFEDVHAACPALRRISYMLRSRMHEEGYVTDPFGHIYGGDTKNSQMLVVHLVQGCGTGSVPKAMTIANYRTLHSLDSEEPRCFPCLFNRFRNTYSYGMVCGSTHDECAFRISLGLPEEEIVRLIRKCLFNMEEKFSPLFDNIPLRAQLAVSLTNASEQVELNHRQPDFERKLIDDYIIPGKRRCAIAVS